MKYTDLKSRCNKYSELENLLPLNSYSSTINNSFYFNKNTKNTNMNMSKHNFLVNKSYEFRNNMIHESYFNASEIRNIDNFVHDYVSRYPKGVLLIVNNTHNSEHTILVHNFLQHKIKYTIFLSNQDAKFSNCMENGTATISRNIKQAAQFAHNMATNGQAILFCGVNQSFDLFSYIL